MQSARSAPFSTNLPVHANHDTRPPVNFALQYIWPEFVGADLSKVSLMEALSSTSFDATRRTMFIIEGLVYYLPPAAVKQQLTAISETAVRGSRLFFDFMHLDALSGEVFRPGLETLLVVSAIQCDVNWARLL